MTFSFNSGQNLDSGSGTNHVKLLATVPSGGLLHEVNVQGICYAAYEPVGFTTGVYPTKNLSAGLQYGAVGHVPTGITDGTATGETWLEFASALPSIDLINDVIGTSPTNVMERASFGVKIRWRGLLYMPSGSDLHFECGENGAGTGVFNFKLDYTWWVGWST